MPLSEIQGLHLPFEQVLLQKALEKHIHRSDIRKGINHNTRNVYGEIAAEKAGHSEKDDFHAGVHSAKAKQRATEGENNKTLPRPTHFPPAVSSELNVGTMDVMPPKLGGIAPIAVRCRISKCINLVEPDVEAVQNFMRNHCAWKPMPLQVLGGMHYETASLRFPAPPHRFNASPRDSHYGSKPERQRFLTASGKASETGAVEDWAFLRRLPAGATTKLQAKSQNKPFAKAFGHRANLETFYSDVKALLGNNAEEESMTEDLDHTHRAVSALEFLTQAPGVTQSRWLRLLRPYDHQRWETPTPATARFVVQALASEPTQFRVVTSDDGCGKETSMLQLLGEDSAAHGGDHKSLFQDDGSYGGREFREKRFGNAMKCLQIVDAMAKEFQAGGVLMMDAERFDMVARAVDRAESLRLCGGLAAAGDRTRTPHIPGDRMETGCSKVRKGTQLTPEWLAAALAEASDEDQLEDGESVRLLVKASHPSRAPHDNITGGTSPTNPTHLDEPYYEDAEAFEEQHWVSLNRSLASRVLQSSRTSISEHDQLVSDSTRSSQHRQLAWPRENDAEIFYRFLEILERRVLYIESGDRILRPVLLEALLQYVAQHWPGHREGEVVPGFSGALVSHLLWERCGWDTPLGRRLLRRLQVVFSQNSRTGTGLLSRESFLKMAVDAGLLTKRDVSSKNARFGKAFSDIVGESTHAHFPDFVRLIEKIAYWRSQASELSHFENSGLALMRSEARHWPHIEHAVLQLVGSKAKPSAPEWGAADSPYHRPSALSIQSSSSVHAAVDRRAEEMEEIPERPSSKSPAFSDTSRPSLTKDLPAVPEGGLHKKKVSRPRKKNNPEAIDADKRSQESPASLSSSRSSNRRGSSLRKKRASVLEPATQEADRPSHEK